MDQPLPNVITNDTPCRKCSYNLRGLSSEGLCPECGTPAGLSLFGNLLKFSNPTWLYTLARGAKFIVYGIAVIFLGTICLMIYSIAAGPSNAAGQNSLQLMQAIVMVTGNLLVVAGSWLVTEPDPSGLGEDQYGTSRQVIRITLAVSLLNTFASLPFMAVAIPIPITQLVSLIGGISGFIGLIAQLQYFGKLADRIPEPSLSKRANSLKRSLPAIYLLLILSSVAIALFAKPAGAAVSPIMGLACFVAILAILLLVQFLMYLRLIERLGKAFQRQAEFAAQISQQLRPNS